MAGKKVSVYDITGKTVCTDKTFGSADELRGMLRPGTYIICTGEGSDAVRMKIVIK